MIAVEMHLGMAAAGIDALGRQARGGGYSTTNFALPSLGGVS